MVNNLLNNPTFSSTITQSRGNSSINGKNENVNKQENVAQSAGNSRIEALKKSIQEGSYTIDIKGSAEKLAQNLLGE
ncbi:flagellar biosynthesis anti-sigma factor FlgM [Helicobacter burdigaliensis]|uniref:flagellar biosynthesis anti-sigma factor FlgM n=1 Tax=Helicobacter burdigaliensis TaxID=2315334 RepID=UPI000EF6AB26|nr:flagellar biosynthesis anti-sigma factor FlgM [Helicobacter burdigaliensis]